MAESEANQQSNVPSNNDYDLALDDTPLTMEEEAVLSQIDESQALPIEPSPGPRKRKRGLSASPHLTPTRLRSSMKATARALDAGFKPNTSHSFRQEPLDRAVSLDAGSIPTDAATRRSESIDPIQHPGYSAGSGHSERLAHRSGSTDSIQQSVRGRIDPARRSESTGPTPQPENGYDSIQQSVRGRIDPARRSESTGPTPQPGNGYDSIQQSVRGRIDPARRSESTGPTPQPGNGYPSGYYPQPMLGHGPPAPIQLPYGAYSGPGQSHPHSMPPPYLPPPGMGYGGPQTMRYYPNMPLQGQPMGMPTEGPNPASDVFSPHYTASDSQKSLHPSSAESTSAAPSAHSSAISNGAPPQATRLDSGKLASTKSNGDSATLPKISVQPATPLAASHQVPNNQFTDHEDHHGAALDMDSPTVGRISKVALQALRDGFKELDAAVKRISAQTGLTPIQIVERWDATKSRVVSSWNIYQGFFQERREEELSRLPQDERPLVGAIPSKAVVSACYDLFRAARPDSYDEILRAWHRLHIMADKGDMSVAKRATEFKKHGEKLDSLIRQASNLYGFESVCITVGGVVNQDQNLGQIIGSDATVDFFMDRYRSTDHLALGQMKAHVYDRLSKQMAVDGIEDQQDVHPPIIPVKKEATPATMGEMAPVSSVADLKEKFIEQAIRHGVTITKGSSLIWKGLPQAVAEAGCVFINWPEDVPFPCDDAYKQASKGISVLKQPARALLLAAFSHPTHPLRLEKKYSSGVPQDKPVIIGVPPDSNSPHAFGRRKFLDDNLNEDRKGPPRLKAAKHGSAAAHKSTSKKKEALHSSKRAKQAADELDELQHASDNSNAVKPPSRPSKKDAPSKSNHKVQFLVPDNDDDGLDAPYVASRDGSPQYSGSDDDAPLVRSPHLLRRKASTRSIAGKKALASKQNSSAMSVEDDEDEDPMPAKKKAPKQKPSAMSVEDDEDEDPMPAKKKAPKQKPSAMSVEDDEDEDPMPAKKKAPKQRPSAMSVEDDGDEDPMPAKKKALKQKPSAMSVEDDEDEGPMPAKKKALKQKPSAMSVEDDEDEDPMPGQSLASKLKRKQRYALVEEDDDKAKGATFDADGVPPTSEKGHIDASRPPSPLSINLKSALGAPPRAEEESVIDGVAAKLFGSTSNPQARGASNLAPRPAQQNHAFRATASSIDSIPQQQSMDYPHPPDPRQEGPYPMGYPVPFMDPYGRRYAPAEHGPPPGQWNAPPGQGWYPPLGPTNPTGGHPSSNPPMAGYHSGYWSHQGPPIYPGAYGQYPSPNMSAASDASHGRQNQAGPSAE